MAQATFRIATAQDAIDIHSAREGIDIVCSGNNGDNIFLSPAAYPLLNNLGGANNAKLLIEGGDYGWIATPLTGTDFIIGSTSNYIIITNCNGQVRIGAAFVMGADGYGFRIWESKYFRITGKYELGVSGDPNFLGHDAGYAWCKDKYGIILSDGFAAPADGGYNFRVVSDYRIDYVQAGYGQYSNSFKPDGPLDKPMQNVLFEHNYFPMGNGEIFYVGNTKAEPQATINNFTFRNNILAYSAYEMFQSSQVAGNIEIHNNIFFQGALKWKAPFQRYQDKNIQLGFKEPSYRFHHNVVIGGGEMLHYLAKINYLDVLDDGSDGIKAIDVYDNLYIQSRNFWVWLGNTTSQDPAKRTPYNFDRNYIMDIIHEYNQVYINSSPTYLLFNSGNTNNEINIRDNQSNQNIPFSDSGFSNVTESGNQLNVDLPKPQFVNSGFADDIDYGLFDFWTKHIGEDEEADRNELPFAGTYRWNPSRYNSTIDFSATFSIVLTPYIGVGESDNVPDYSDYIGNKFRIGEFGDIENTFAICTLTAWSNTTKQATLSIPEYTNGTLTGISDWEVGVSKSYYCYDVGKISIYHGKFYESIWAGNKYLSFNRKPDTDVSGATIDGNGRKVGTYWSQIHWWDGSAWQEDPPNDLRLKSDDFYALRGIGIIESTSSVNKTRTKRILLQ